MIPCSCVGPGHERPSCPQRRIVAMQARVYAGMYEGTRVRLLNPRYTGDDATCRRFALLEIE